MANAIGSKEKIKANDVVAPTLFVGIGGTGSKIVTKVAELCLPEETENINFLCLDTNVNDLGNVASSKANIFWVQTSNTQTVGSYLDFDEDARKNWFPKNAVMYDKTVSEGAGQVRAISRLALNSTIKTGKIRPLYDSIDDLFRKTGKEMKQAMRVVIASTASGGTGSGMLLPLSMFIRDYVKEKYPNTSLIVRALILLPETLDSVIDSQTERDSKARNAYATIKELNAFMMKGSGFIDLDEDLKQFSNLHVDVSIAGSDKLKTLALLPTDFCFLMDGQDAEDSTMISINQYIEQAAQALYEQNVGPMQKKAFSVEDNIIKEMTKPGNYGRNRFGGIGAGVIRYPYEKIADYVAYDLAIDSIGGSGDASKWTQYDRAYDLYKEEQKKLGLGSTAIEKPATFYPNKVDSNQDAFSKDLKNSALDKIDERISDFFVALDQVIADKINSNQDINERLNNAEPVGQRMEYGEGENWKKLSSHIQAVVDYKDCVFAKGKDSNYNIASIASRFIEGVLTRDSKMTVINEDYTIERLLKNAFKEVAHPCAARYILYRLQSELSARIDRKEFSDSEGTINDYYNKKYEYKFSKGKVTGINNLLKLAKTEPTFSTKAKGLKKMHADLAEDLPTLYESILEFSHKRAQFAAYEKLNEYVTAYSEEFEKFFKTFGDKVKELARRKEDLVDELKYQKGDSCVNVCAEKNILEELSKFSLQKAQKETTMLNSEVNGDIFDSIKKNAIFNMELKKAGDAFIEEDKRVNIFDDILLGYFRTSVREKCDEIDKDIIGAIELEKRLKERLRLRNENPEEGQIFESVTTEDVKRYILETIEKGGRIAAPSIQRAVNEEPREIKVCAYNRSLLDNRKYRVKDLMPNGEAVDTVSKYEIHFYNALYNLTPDKLKKFAAPFDTETGHKNAGTYQKAYFDYSKSIGPDSTKNAAISTHIDKRWDSIKSMPEIDFNYQNLVIKKIHKAFVYGLIHKAILQKPLSAVANGKKVFLYRNSENRDNELVVPNGTLCDEFYEILDALYVNAKVVEDINLIKSRKRAMSTAKNCNYEDTEFFRDMASLNLLKFLSDYEEAGEKDIYDGTQKSLEALKDRLRENNEKRSALYASSKNQWEAEDDGEIYIENPTSIFEIPLMYYCSLPNSGRYISEITAMVEAVIDVLREEFTTWYAEKDVKFVLCTRLTDELNLLKRNYHVYEEYQHAPLAADNPVIDIIQRQIREVILSAPEPEDYEALLDKVAKEFNEGGQG